MIRLTSRLWKTCALLLLLLSTSVWAGGGDAGNGGYGVVCREKVSGRIHSIDMHDLWWGKHEQGLPVQRDSRPAREQVQEKVARLLALDPDFFARLQTEIDTFEEQKRFADTLQDPNDLYTSVRPMSRRPESPCASEPIINYKDGGPIVVNREAWEFLTSPPRNNTPEQSDLAAFYLHEGIYKIFRLRKKVPENVVNTALLVASVFALREGAELRDWYRKFLDERDLPVRSLQETDVVMEEGIESTAFRHPKARHARGLSTYSWLFRCRAWKRRVRQELDAFVQWVRPQCGLPQVISLPDGSYKTVSTCAIEFRSKTPGAVVLTRLVHGRYVSLVEDASGTKARESLAAACAQWRKQMRAEYDPRFVRASCGLPQLVSQSTAKGEPLSRVAFAIGHLALVAPGISYVSDSPIEGESVRWDPANPFASLLAARRSYQARCREWLSAQRRMPDYLYATCEGADAAWSYERGPITDADSVKFRTTGHLVQVK